MTSQVKYVKYVKFDENDIKNLAMDRSVSGSGTESDPFLFDSVKELPSNLQIEDSALYLVFSNCNITYLRLKCCENILYRPL